MQPTTRPKVEAAGYDRLLKPSWAPTNARISQVWTYLTPLIIASFGYALFRTLDGWYPAPVRIPFILNLLLLLVLVRHQPRQRQPGRVLAMVLTVDLTLIAVIIVIVRYSPVVAVVQLPYLAWLGLLTATQFAIWRSPGKPATTVPTAAAPTPTAPRVRTPIEQPKDKPPRRIQ